MVLTLSLDTLWVAHMVLLTTTVFCEDQIQYSQLHFFCVYHLISLLKFLVSLRVVYDTLQLICFLLGKLFCFYLISFKNS